MKPKTIVKSGIFFRGLHGKTLKPYPAWRYHKIREPIIVNDTEEDKQAEGKGFHRLDTLKHTSILMNHMNDFEDMSTRQLRLYIKEEFNVDLPPEANKLLLMKAVWKLSMTSPENKDRVVLLAQSIRMNYDETLEEIKKAMNDPEVEYEKEVIYG